MSLEFKCTNCGQEIIIRHLKIGETACCRKCGAYVQVPENAVYCDKQPQYESSTIRSSFDHRINNSDDFDLKDSHLADRITRLGAQLLDSLVALLMVLPGLLIMLSNESGSDNSAVGILVLFSGIIFIVICQAYLLSTRGQTIGKRALRIKIVSNSDESNPGFFRIILLRGVAPAIIEYIPIVGSIFALVDIIFIFGKERRCIHDYFASTKVIVIK